MALTRGSRLLAACGAIVLPLLLLILPVRSAWAASRPLCLRCHPVHYAAQGTCTTCHRGNDRASRQSLAHHDLIPAALAGCALRDTPSLVRGRQLAEQLACRRCHRLAGRGNRLASDLDRVAATAPVGQLQGALLTPAWYMPDFRLASRERDALVTYLLAAGAAAPVRQRSASLPQVVHFADAGVERQDPFNRHCGGCHLTLTTRFGGLGQGRVAPNLAGLLGAFYPHTFADAKPWTTDRLRRWLANPRSSRPLATMPPVPLTPAEFSALTSQLDPS